MVHVKFDPASVDLDEFFQEGGALYFEGIPYQRGYGIRGAGIGGIFRSLIRYILPIAKKAGKSVGKEALVTGAKILDNIAQGAELKEAVVNEAKSGVKRLAKRVADQSGSGIRRKRRKKVSKKKSPKRRRKRSLTKRQLLGKKVLKTIALNNPKTPLGFY